MATGRIAASRHCHVYLVRAASGQIKIGRSVKPETRIAGIQTGSPVRVELVHSWKMETAEAVAFEKALHRLFRWSRTSGEWHDASEDDIRGVGDMHLAGQAEGAAALADAIAAASAAYEAYEKASRAARAHVLRFRPEERRAAEEEAETLRVAWSEAEDAAYELGRPDPWGLSPKAMEEKRVAREAERGRPAVEPNPDRVWRKPPSGAYGDHRAALSRYKEARGIQ